MPRPSRVILITSDHMRADFIAAQGQSWLHTPNLDRLVTHGVSFTDCFAQNPVCMPSRASFLTSCYPAQTGVDANGYELPDDFAPQGASAFAAAGFTTGHIGKLHLQCHLDHDLESRSERRYGFEWFERSESRGCYHDAYIRWLDSEHPELRQAFRTFRPSDPQRGNEMAGQVVEAPWTASHAGWLAARATSWCQSPFFGRLDRPAFLHLGFHHPHPPLNPTRDAFAPYRDAAIPAPRSCDYDGVAGKPEWIRHMHRPATQALPDAVIEGYRRHFAALVSEMDLAIGALIDDLEQRGALDDTLLVFTSDHGDMCGDHGLTHKGPHFYDEVMRVPLVMHWPAGFGRERRTEANLIEMTDLMPTLLGCCQAPIPAAMQGIDWSDQLRHGHAIPGRDSVYASNRDIIMLRTRAAKYLMQASTGDECLYDYRDGNAHETTNRAEDPAAASLLASMRHQALQRHLLASVNPHVRERPF